MARYTVDSVVCDYGLFVDGELKLICNSLSNAKLIKEIMEKDDLCNRAPYEFGKDDFDKFENSRTNSSKRMLHVTADKIIEPQYCPVLVEVCKDSSIDESKLEEEKLSPYDIIRKIFERFA